MKTEEELIELGTASDELLSSKAFGQVTNHLVEQAFQAFVNSAPDAHEKREQIFRHYRSLVDVVNSLKENKAVKDEILTKLNNREEEA